MLNEPIEKHVLLELIIKSIPYPEQMVHINMDYADCIRFYWRGVTFEVSTKLHVSQIKDVFEVGSNYAILLEKLIADRHALYLEDEKIKRLIGE